jgi:hypothetical protein
VGRVGFLQPTLYLPVNLPCKIRLPTPTEAISADPDKNKATAELGRKTRSPKISNFSSLPSETDVACAVVNHTKVKETVFPYY